MEAVLLLGIVLVIGFLACVLVIPVVALVRTRKIADLITRLERLERDERGPTVDNLTTDRVRDLQERLERLERRLEASPVVRPVEAASPEPAAATVQPPRPVTPRKVTAPADVSLVFDAARLESWIGRRGLGWVAVVLLLFSTAFFLKYAFENRWIGELGRVALGTAAGVGLCGWGYAYHRRGWRAFSQMLTSGGVVLLYLVTFSAFGYYHLIPQASAAIFLMILVAETASLAALYEAPAIALMAVVGGLLTPLLLHSERDQYISLFSYLLILNAGMGGLALVRRWPAIGTVALLGSEWLFWLWYQENYHPAKLGAALVFTVALFAVYLAHGALARRATIEDLVRQILNAIFVGAAGYVLLDEDYHVWMGTLAVAMASVYALFGWLILHRRPDDRKALFVAVATSMGFVACAIPLQAHAAWIPFGWAVQGALLWGFGLRINARALCGTGCVLLVLAVARLVLFDTPYAGRTPFVPIFNLYAFPALLVSACLFACAAVARLSRFQLDAGNNVLAPAAGLVGIGLVWLILSVETYTFFGARAALGQPNAPDLLRSGRTALSVVWAAYAALLLWCGFRMQSLLVRWVALILFAITLIKVFVFDMGDLPGLYRVLAFFVLSIMMGAAAWGYQKVISLRRA
jgi:uncharacterized membrane protein